MGCIAEYSKKIKSMNWVKYVGSKALKNAKIIKKNEVHLKLLIVIKILELNL